MQLLNSKERLMPEKMNITLTGCILIHLLFTISKTASLECYSCSDALHVHECKAVENCKEEQVCFKKREFTNQVYFDMGCIDKERCGEFTDNQNGSRDAKLSADKTSYCYECCSGDKCNEDICEYLPHSLCMDDKSTDCARLNSMFSICKIKNEAKKICPRFCELCDLVDGNWSPWSSWLSCDVTCGIGSLLRHRTCTDPAPQNGGLDCPGKGIEMKPCKLKLCPVHGGWNSWENWGECSATCGVGIRSRKRSCTDPRPRRLGDHCFGDSTVYELCDIESCAVNGGWSIWSDWGQCSVSCDVGLQTRTRSCTNPTPQNSGDTCIGQNIEDKVCHSDFCAINGGWSGWTKWGQCSVTCGVGLQTRTRSCTNPSPKDNGRQCVGQNIEDKLCNLGFCDGVWTDWQAWDDCNVECGQGMQTRKRTCLKQLFSAECDGNATDSRSCETATPCTDCLDIKLHNGKHKSGVFNVVLWKTHRVMSVYCDQDTDGGGWTVFQYRFNGSVHFYRNFVNYENGFGNVNGEFWLGLKNVFEMVSQGETELRLDLTSADGATFQEIFKNFRLGDSPRYSLYFNSSSIAGIDGLSQSNGRSFSTFDADQDFHSSFNFASYHRGGWWYSRHYSTANLNGIYVHPGKSDSQSMFYTAFRQHVSLKISKMMFRRV